MNTSLRLLYISGPGNIIATFEHWRDGEDDPSEVNVTYSGQFFDVCRDENLSGCAIATTGPRDAVDGDTIRVLHRPIPFATSGPLLYHLGQVLYGIRIFFTALRQRSDIVIIARGTHWFLLTPLTWMGIHVVPSLHCVLWPKYGRRSRVQARIDRWNGHFFRTSAYAILSASDDIGEQVSELTGGASRPRIEFLPLYRRESFEAIAPPEWRRRPFRVLYAGRIEGYKGVYDLLDVARTLHSAGYREIEFDLCGTGAAYHDLKGAVSHAGLEAVFRLQGHCGRAAMHAMYGKAHAVIVPTTTRFVEGFNQVVVESILSGRPVITSSVCPAIAYVREAVVDVPPDDVAAYADAVRRLFEDEGYYETKQGACAAAQEQFYDRDRSWYSALRAVVAAHAAGHEPASRSWVPEPTPAPADRIG